MAYKKLNEVDSTTGVGSILVVENGVIKQITDTDVVKHYGIDGLNKRVSNLEKRLSTDHFYTDDIVAYIKDVPENICPYAEVSKVGGMTRKCTNLFPFPYAGGESKVTNGITFTRLADGGIRINGTNTHTTYVEYPIITTNSLIINASQLTMSLFGPDTGGIYCTVGSGGFGFGEVKSGSSIVLDGNGTSQIFTYGLVRVKAGATVSNVTVYPMLNSGSTALPYEPYFEGLRSAPVTEVESVGANLTTAQAVYEGANAYAEMVVDGRNCIKFTSGIQKKNYPIKFKENTQYTVSFYAKSENVNGATAHNYAFTFWYSDDSVSCTQVFLTDTSWTLKTLTSTAGKTVVAVGVQVMEYRANVYLDVDTFMFNEGATALPYVPYAVNSLSIPEAVRNLDGYGWGVNESVYNYIDWENKQFVKRVGKVDLGTLDWKRSSSGNGFYALLKDAVDMYYGGGGVCSKYDVRYSNDNKSLYTTKVTSEVGCVVVDSDYTDAATFKSAMSGVMLYYELAEPIITDISDILPEDNFIYVESGGKLTFVNEHEFAVPSTVTYMSKEVSA